MIKKGLLVISGLVCMVMMGCGDVEGYEHDYETQQDDVEMSSDYMDETDKQSESEIFLTGYKSDLTGDGKEDRITFYWNVGESGKYSEKDADDFLSRPDYYLNKDGSSYVDIRVYESDSDKIIYKESIGRSHNINGQLFLVKSDDKYYLMLGSHECGQDLYSMGYTVMDFQGGNYKTVDSMNVEFAPDKENYEYHKSNGRNIELAQDVLPKVKAGVEKWTDNSVLLLCCDISSPQEIYFNANWQYDASTYYKEIWEMYGIK